VGSIPRQVLDRFSAGVCVMLEARRTQPATSSPRSTCTVVGSIPRCPLDYFRASQATHPPSSGIALHHSPISLCLL
jgi:hypothetical protein